MADLELNALTLTNFKGFNGSHNLQLARDPGLYHISGRNRRAPELGANGVGKSTLWDAVMWVLFNRTGRDNKPGAAVQPWSGDKKVEVHLSLRRGKRSYGLVRTRNPNHLWLHSDDEDKRREITQDEVFVLLGMSEETFRRTVILGQFGTLFLDLKPEPQAQMFSEALNLNVWLDAAERASDALKIASKRGRELLTDSESLKAVIEELSASITEARERSDAFEEETERKVRKTKKALKRVQTKLEELRDALGEEPSLPKSPKRIAEILDELQAEPDALDEAKRKASRKAGGAKTCSKCGQPVANEAVQKELARLDKASKERTNVLHAELKECQQKRAVKDKVYQDMLNEYRAKQREISELQREEGEYQRALARLEEAENADALEVKRLKKRRKAKRAELQEVSAEMTAVLEKTESCSFWAKAFKEIRLNIIDEVLAELEIASNRHAVNLGLVDWSIRFETEREAKSGAVSYSFTVMLFPPNQEKPIKWESYSGGESQRWQLAVAFALSEVLLARAGLSPNIEVLDEPTRGLSPEGISDLLEHLRDRALELNRAIYLVDHHSLDRGAFDGTLLVTRGKKGSKFSWL